MAPRRIDAVLSEILEAINGIEQATANATFEQFEREWLLRHGVQRGIEIISEACRHIPDEILDRHPDIPWKKVHGIGNLMRHEYHKIADHLIWAVVVDNLPALKRAVLAIWDRSVSTEHPRL